MSEAIVIIESPNKVEKVKKYSGYETFAKIGHFMNLVSFDESFKAKFEYDEKNEKIFLKSTLNKEEIKFKRSSLIKEQYFKKHKINKNISFELHHIVPFYFAKDLDMLKAIDDWHNLIYIDANSHKILTLDKNIKLAIRLSFDNDDVVLENFTGAKLILKKEQNVSYNKDLKTEMENYNRSLL